MTIKIKPIITLFLIFCSFNIMYSQGDGANLDAYFSSYRSTGISDYQSEKKIIESNGAKKLAEQLAPYYSDSLVNIRQKAYYITYKNGLLELPEKSTIAVNRLLKGCLDVNGGIVGQNLDFLKQFPATAFDAEAKSQIETILSRRQIVHFKKAVLLAGYVGAASELMIQQLQFQDISVEKKWAYSLALARQGDIERINYCLNSVKKVPLNNDMVHYIIPDLIYIRQKETIDYCVELLNNNEPLCTSADPDNQVSMVCGYYIMELLAPVVENFPFKTDGTGTLETADYESALVTVRTWFKANPEYGLIKNIF